MLQDLNHAVLQTLQKIIWKDIYVLQDDLVNKALPFAKLSPWVCWWIWIFLSFLRKFHVKDFIPIGTLCITIKIHGKVESFTKLAAASMAMALH